MAMRARARHEGASHARALALQGLKRIRRLLVAAEADVEAVRRCARPLTLNLHTALREWAAMAGDGVVPVPGLRS